MRLSRRQVIQLPIITSAAAALPGIAHATPTTISGAYNQITVDGEYVQAGFEGAEHALAAYAAIFDVTGNRKHERIAAALLEYALNRRPTYMGTYLGRQLLRNDFLGGSDTLWANLDSYVGSQLDRFANNPNSILRSGDIRNLAGRAELLVSYADHLERRGRDTSAVDAASQAMLQRLADLQFTSAEAETRFGSERFTGAFPHLITGDDGSMGSWDITTWALSMLSLDQYDAIKALAKGYGRFQLAAYNNAAAAGSRQLLATTHIDPDLIYAGAPAGFPLDGAEFAIDDEGGDQPYLITYGWSPNAIAQLGSVLRALRESRVTVPQSPLWHSEYWTGTPKEIVLDPHSYSAGLAAKVRFTHDFFEATQLPVSADFPWIDLERTTFPSTGEEDFRRGGWFDGSGRGTMSAVYSRLAVTGYVESGGDNANVLDRAAQWWYPLITWQ